MSASQTVSLSSPYATGIALGLISLLPHLALPGQASVAYSVVLLGIISGVYLGFAFAKGTSTQVIVEVTAATIFGVTALLGATVSIWFIPIGYAAHGFWDLAHHGRRRGDEVFAKVPVWYPPFCAAVDWIIAVGLIVIWWRNGVF